MSKVGIEIGQHNSSSDSALIDVFTGVLDTGRLTELRDRAIYDEKTLTWNPLADAGTGVIFPNAVEAKTKVESSLRLRPTKFKGPKQLDLDTKTNDVHYNRQIHPNAWVSEENQFGESWYKPDKNGLPFVGFPNPNYFNFYTDSITTHNLQNVSHTKVLEALQSSNAELNPDSYVNSLGSLLNSAAVPDKRKTTANYDNIQQLDTDGFGVNSDPSSVQNLLYDQFESDFSKARQLRVEDTVSDPRFSESNLSNQLLSEQLMYNESKETEFSKMFSYGGIHVGSTQPETFKLG